MLHDFKQCLDIEQSNEHLAVEALCSFFPDAVVTRNPSGPTAQQFNGEDYELVLSNGKRLTVDVKADTYTTGNMVLEFWNHYDDGREPSKGWALKATTNDYILYQFVNLGVSYLLDKSRLATICRAQLPAWKSKYRAIECPNRTASGVSFKTKSLLVPLSEIERLFGTSSKIG